MKMFVKKNFSDFFEIQEICDYRITEKITQIRNGLSGRSGKDGLGNKM